MNLVRTNIYWSRYCYGIQKQVIIRFLIYWTILLALFTSCDMNPYGSRWVNENDGTIYHYLEKNNQEYSKFYRILEKGRLLLTLSAYNPNGDGYTLFLPTDEAIDHFIEQNQEYSNFEELLQDTGFIKFLTRYHTLNGIIHSDNFPDGAFKDSTLTGHRLAIGVYSEEDSLIIKVNNVAPVVKSINNMTNGNVHVISKVLEPVNISGFDWLQQQDEYSILSKAVEYSGLRNYLRWDKYTILAEHDSIYNKNGIYNIDDLIERIATPELLLTSRGNYFYQFTATHIVSSELYLNDFPLGRSRYNTMGREPVLIEVGHNIRINNGEQTYGFTISESEFVDVILEGCNIMTGSGPIHSISKLLIFESLRE